MVEDNEDDLPEDIQEDIYEEPLDDDDLDSEFNHPGLGDEGRGDLNAGIKNTIITVGRDVYGVGLFWQPIQDPDDTMAEISETAENVVDGADLYAIRLRGTPQYGLGVSSSHGLKTGMKVASIAVADAFSDKPSSVAVFKVKEGWWFISLRNDLILAEEDKLFVEEKDAKAAFSAMMSVPDWGRKIAPSEWNIAGTSYIELEDILKNTRPVKLARIGSEKNIRNLIVVIGAVIVILIGFSYLLNSVFTPKKPALRPPPVAAIKKTPQIEQEDAPPPWEKLVNPEDMLMKCANKMQELRAMTIPGWKKVAVVCNANGEVTSDWVRERGRISWFTNALNILDLSGYTNAIVETGANGRIGTKTQPIEIVNSPPELTGKEIQLEMRDIFNTIKVDVRLNSVVEGEKQAASSSKGSGKGASKNKVNEQQKPLKQYFAITFSFTSGYEPKMWIEALRPFNALTLERIRYDIGKNLWSYEGKIYEKR